jgi:hypothetical protein
MEEISVFDSNTGISPEEEEPILQVKSWKEYNELTDKQKAAVAAHNKYRRRMCFLMKAEGMHYELIASKLKVSVSTVLQDIRRYSSDLVKVGAVDPEHEKNNQIHRLDTLMMTYFQRAVEGDIDAANIYLGLENRRTKLLGLDQPTKMKINHNHRSSKVLTEQEKDQRLMEVAERLEKKGVLPDHLRQWRDSRREKGLTIDVTPVRRE